MKKKIAKGIGAAKLRVLVTKLAYQRALKAYEHWLRKELNVHEYVVNAKKGEKRR